ncbi:neutral zinc metallopeptidase [Mucilaginibacter galii]|uniref:Flagellar biosynthesis protein FlgM n=1 Tax=Mucilaginibacter galii TaxID=2005073 RepID=A0A917J8F4_9SPHI|nr:neutral zinc metallopeptidase [Mucilaginibacter galii]GGI49832.1 flagellar biosynthesis protein FlgM [Mucilaginibacter galii]
MQWMGRRESSNAEEGSSSGGGGRMALGGGVLGIIGFVIYMFTGVNPTEMLQGGNSGQSQGTQQNTKLTQSKSDEQKFARVVLADTEDTWNQLFKDMGRTYKEPTIHFFEEGVETSGCGFAGSATGPFYCPGDQKVFLDLSFFTELEQRFGAAGDFARAYVIAHEVGHHVQKLLGVSDKMDQARQQLSEEEYNKLSVKLELQADFYAGVWAYYENKRGLLEAGDIGEALNAANAIGDDRLTKGQVSPDSFTHGTSAQRVYWFKKGFETGDVKQGDTFNSPDLN